MSELSLLADLEKKLVRVEVPPTPTVILKGVVPKEGEEEKAQPDAVVFVNAVTPKEFTQLNDDVKTVLENGFRPKSRHKDAKEEEIENKRFLRWVKKLIHHSEGFTVGNMNRILTRAQLEFDVEQAPDLLEKFDTEVDGRMECDLGTHREVAVLILKVTRGADFHAIVEETAREAAVMHAEALEGKEDA